MHGTMNDPQPPGVSGRSRVSLRPLLPASISTSVAAAPPPPPEQQVPTRLGKRTRVTIACFACRKLRTKCNGQQPQCDRCTISGTTCKFAEPDASSVKRKCLELEARLYNQEELFRLLQTAPVSTANEVLWRIRQGARPLSILRQVQSDDLALQLSLIPETQYSYVLPYPADLQPLFKYADNPFRNSLLLRSALGEEPTAGPVSGSSDTSAYSIPFHGAQIVDERLNSDSLNISKWTFVSDDDVFLRSLFEVYFQYEYAWYFFFHKDIFLDDLIAVRNEFCSELLVNCILAAACHGMRAIGNRSEFWNPKTYGYQFLAEAKRLWELNGHEATITNVHSASIMGAIYSMNGMDKVGSKYWTQAVVLANELNLFTETSDEYPHRVQKMRTVTAWSLFNYQSMCSFYYFRTPMVKRPPKLKLPEHSTAAVWFGELWFKYPSVEDLVPMHLGHTFLATCNLHPIMVDIGMAGLSFQKPDGSALFAADIARSHYDRLREWYNNLAEPILPENVFLPVHLLLHMLYHNVVHMTFCHFTLADEDQDCRNSNPVILDQNGITPCQVVACSKTCLQALTHMFFRLHGLESHFAYLLKILAQLGFEAAEVLGSPDAVGEMDMSETKAIRATLVLCATGLYLQGHNTFLAEIIFHILKDAMGEDDRKLLQLGNASSEEVEARKALLEKHAHAEYRVNPLSIMQDPSDQKVDEVVKEMAKVEISQWE